MRKIKVILTIFIVLFAIEIFGQNQKNYNNELYYWIDISIKRVIWKEMNTSVIKVERVYKKVLSGSLAEFAEAYKKNLGNNIVSIGPFQKKN